MNAEVVWQLTNGVLYNCVNGSTFTLLIISLVNLGLKCDPSPLLQCSLSPKTWLCPHLSRLTLWDFQMVAPDFKQATRLCSWAWANLLLPFEGGRRWESGRSHAEGKGQARWEKEKTSKHCAEQEEAASLVFKRVSLSCLLWLLPYLWQTRCCEKQKIGTKII